MKLLLLEDDAETSRYVTRLLNEAGHVVDTCTTGRDAIFMATTGDYAVLVLDRMVPRVDGLGVLRAVREVGLATPVLFLTALDEVGYRVEGRSSGADDYLGKSFAGSELPARVTALSRRRPIPEVATSLVVADLEIDLPKRAVTRAGRRFDVQPQEFKLLEYLMRHSGEIVTRTMPLENVWSFHFGPGTNLIESHVSRLRAKVDRGFDRDLIQTVRGAGYRIDG